MAKLLEEWKEDLVEALTEHDLLLGSKHQKIEHAVLLVRNIAVGAALVLFIASLLQRNRRSRFHTPRKRCFCRSLQSFISRTAIWWAGSALQIPTSIIP